MLLRSSRSNRSSMRKRRMKISLTARTASSPDSRTPAVTARKMMKRRRDYLDLMMMKKMIKIVMMTS